MTPVELTAVLGILTQILFEYVPGFTGYFQPKPEQFKRLFMAGLLLLIAIAAVLLSCFADFTFLACTRTGIIDTMLAVLTAAGIGAAVNQGTHALLKK